MSKRPGSNVLLFPLLFDFLKKLVKSKFLQSHLKTDGFLKE